MRNGCLISLIFVYLAVVMDLFFRKIIGWSLDKTMMTKLIMNALSMAVACRPTEPGLILHSDQGVQCRASDYVLAMHDERITPNMGRKEIVGIMQPFFASLKVEEVYACSYHGLQDAYSSVFEYIEMFYNRVWKYSTNGNISPVEYENNYYQMST